MTSPYTDTVTFFIYAFTSVFVIVNPVSGLMSFLSLTAGMDKDERRYVAGRSVAIACVLAVVFAVSGEFILRLFNITADSLRVAGGILLLMIAMDMLHARTSRESMTPEEVKEAAKREDISVFPIAIPLLTGPGAITTVILVLRAGETPILKTTAVAAILLTFTLAYFIFRFAVRINKFMGVTVSLVITRVMGLFLGAIAVDFIAEGVWNIYKAFTG